VQKATTAQLRLQAEAALALLNELKAEPRMETLAIAEAQVCLAETNLKAVRDQYDKDRASYDSTRNRSARTCWTRRGRRASQARPRWTWRASNMT
jgi:hypothetical protein